LRSVLPAWPFLLRFDFPPAVPVQRLAGVPDSLFRFALGALLCLFQVCFDLVESPLLGFFLAAGQPAHLLLDGFDFLGDALFRRLARSLEVVQRVFEVFVRI